MQSENRKNFLSGQPTHRKSAEGGGGVRSVCVWGVVAGVVPWCHSVVIGSVLQSVCRDVAMFLAFCLDMSIIIRTFAAYKHLFSGLKFVRTVRPLFYVLMRTLVQF